MGAWKRFQIAIGAVPEVSQKDISSAQKLLRENGSYAGVIDGRFGPQTRASILKYQQEAHLPLTGQLDDVTLERLGIKKSG